MKKALALSAAVLAAGAMLAAPAQATALDKTKAQRLAMALTLTKNTKASYNAWARFKINKDTPQVKEYKFNWNTDGCSVPRRSETLNTGRASSRFPAIATTSATATSRRW